MSKAEIRELVSSEEASRILGVKVWKSLLHLPGAGSVSRVSGLT